MYLLPEFIWDFIYLSFSAFTQIKYIWGDYYLLEIVSHSRTIYWTGYWCLIFQCEKKKPEDSFMV